MCSAPNTTFTPDQHRRVPTRRTSGAVILRYRPMLHVPQDATTGMAAIKGQWPGDETDEEIDQFLENLS